MRILITGGAGFLGSHLCDRLIAEGGTHLSPKARELYTAALQERRNLLHERAVQDVKIRQTLSALSATTLMRVSPKTLKTSGNFKGSSYYGFCIIA